MFEQDNKFFRLFIIITSISLILFFVFISYSIRPLSIWLNYQNTCIKEESVGKTIPWAVRKCNGRSKVYQVK